MTLTSVQEEATSDRTSEINQMLTHLHSTLSEVRYGHVYGVTKMIRQHGPAADLAAITYLNAVNRNPTIADNSTRERAIYDCKVCLSGRGMVCTDEGQGRTYRPCDICNPMAYQIWKEGHAGCRHRDECNTCRRIMQAHTSTPIYREVRGRNDSDVGHFLN